MRSDVFYLFAFTGFLICFCHAPQALSQPGKTSSDNNSGALQLAYTATNEPGDVDPRMQEVSALRLKRDQMRQDSMVLETKVSEKRMEIIGEGRRIDSLLLIATAVMKTVAAKQIKARESAANNPEQVKLDDIKKQMVQVEAQIASIKAEITAVAADRERLRTSSGSAEKKIDQSRSPLATTLANTQTLLSEKINEREALKSLDEMIRLDSAIAKAKNDLNSAIEKKAMGKRGAGKLVEQYENDVSTLMGQLDDAKRKNPKTALFETKLANAASTRDKRTYAAKFMALVTTEIASLTARRDQAQRNLNDFDRMNPSPVKSWSRRLGQLDDMTATKTKLMRGLALRHDSLDRQMAMLQNMMQGFGAATHAKIRKADSLAVFSKKQWSDLTVRRGQVHGDSMRNESTLSIGLMRLRVELAKASAQISTLTRKITSVNNEQEQRKQSAVEAPSSEEQTKNQWDVTRRTEGDAVAPPASGNAETAQKIMEEIYKLLDSGPIDKAIGLFTAKRSFLLANANFEAFKVLQYAVDQAVMSRKSHARKK